MERIGSFDNGAGHDSHLRTARHAKHCQSEHFLGEERDIEDLGYSLEK